MHRNLVIGTLCGLLALGCSAATPHAGTTPAPRASDEREPFRLIVKFRNPAVDPSTSGFLARLSAETGETFQYLRPLSGGAHLFVISRPLDPDARQALLRRLSADSDVTYAEEDRRMQIQ